MSDFEAMTRIFDLQRIGYKVEKPEPSPREPSVVTTITLEVGQNNVEGYIGFATILSFDKTGCLLKVGIYE